MHELIKQPVSSYTEFEELQWSSDKPIPPVGTEIDVPMNGIGRSKVLKYFVEHLDGAVIHKANGQHALEVTKILVEASNHLEN